MPYSTKTAAKMLDKSPRTIRFQCEKNPDKKDLWFKLDDNEKSSWIITDRGIEFLREVKRGRKWS